MRSVPGRPAAVHRSAGSIVAFSLLTAGAGLITARAPAFLQILRGSLPGFPTCETIQGSTQVRLDEAAKLARRSLLGGGVAAAAGLQVRPARAAEPKVTAQCEFLFRIGYDKTLPLRRVVIDIYGEEAPVHAKTFMQACTATVPGRAGQQARYQLATMKSLSKDRLIGFANFAGGNFMVKKGSSSVGSVGGTPKELQIPLAGPETETDEKNGLKHDRKGRVSMPLGGGSFNFVISPVQDAPWLDSPEYGRVVVGQVSEGLDVIDEFNSIGTFERGSIINQGGESQLQKDFLQQPQTKVQIWKSKEVGSNQTAPPLLIS